MFGKPSIVKENAGLIKQLENGERRPAQHVRPQALDTRFKSFVTGGAEAIFEGFDYFAALLNQHVALPWTIEETGDTHIMDILSDSPSLGRTYKIFYNSVKTGRLQVSDGSSVGGIGEGIEWHRQQGEAYVILELDNLRFVPYDHALSMVSAVELFIGPFENNDVATHRARSNAAEALSGHLWEVMRAGDEYVPSFDHRVTGPYELLRHTTNHWKEGGVDPFERWNGDRLS